MQPHWILHKSQAADLLTEASVPVMNTANKLSGGTGGTHHFRAAGKSGDNINAQQECSPVVH